jgi:hypothetical protein
MNQPSPQTTRQPDRRKAPRLPVHGRLLGTLIDVDRPVRIRDIGPGGFATETVEPLPVKTQHDVRFTAKNDKEAVVSAVSLHSWPSCANDGTPCFVTGFEFTFDDPGQTQEAIRMLIEEVTAVGLYGGE